MRVSFDLDAVEKWANFSGDYNPIHFDPEAAAKITGAGLVVHGMLVLLAVKQAMSNLAPAPNSGGWRRLQTVFRHPVPQSRDLIIGLKSDGAKTRYTVTSGLDDRAHLQGSLSGDMPPAALTSVSEMALDRKQVLQRREYFIGSFPEIQAPWIFLDALLFSEFIEHNAKELLQKTIGGGAVTHTMVQTSQSLWFDHTLTNSLSFLQSFELAYRYAMAEYHRVDDRSIGKVSIEGWLDGRRLLYSELGLMLYRPTRAKPGSPMPELALSVPTPHPLRKKGHNHARY